MLRHGTAAGTQGQGWAVWHPDGQHRVGSTGQSRAVQGGQCRVGSAGCPQAAPRRSHSLPQQGGDAQGPVGVLLLTGSPKTVLSAEAFQFLFKPVDLCY